MKKKDIQQIAGAGLTELQGHLKDAQTKLAGLNAEREAGKLKNTHAVSAARKDVARILTFIAKQPK